MCRADILLGYIGLAEWQLCPAFPEPHGLAEVGFFVFGAPVNKIVRIGILFSRSGDYQIVANASYNGAIAAIEAINADPGRPVRFEARERDPQGRIEQYGPLCRELLRDDDVQHIIGCTTSWSRKDVIPILERHGGLLWYPCPYEGFEASDRVIYTHACPNQHIVPLLAYIVPRFGSDAFLVGSNYIWGWEVNRVARDLIGDVNGRVLGERYLSIGDVDVDRLIAEIRIARPSFILNNLIGQSSYAFLRAYARLGQEDEHFTARHCPVVSCNLTEPELPAIGPAAEGLMSVGPYFANPACRDATSPSSDHAAAYAAVVMLADAIEAAGTADAEAVRQILVTKEFETPLGLVHVDRQTQHTALPVHIGRVEDGAFHGVWQSESAYAPDPYLSRPGSRILPGGSRLRMVS